MLLTESLEQDRKVVFESYLNFMQFHVCKYCKNHFELENEFLMHIPPTRKSEINRIFIFYMVLLAKLKVRIDLARRLML